MVTGHDDGVITINLTEDDDGRRETLRVRLSEPYRTLLGHFRHEIGHWYWTLLVEGTAWTQRFRALFGDETVGYDAALGAHYGGGPDSGWEESYLSGYATSHPWEDWAETFAHYLHIRDTTQTAAAFGIVVGGPSADIDPSLIGRLRAAPREEAEDFDQLIAAWLPLTYALNAVNRSMGKSDLYPFVLSPTVQEKLRLVHRLITGAGQNRRPELKWCQD